MPEPKKIDIGGKVVTSISMTEEQLETLDLLSLGNEDSRSATISRMITEIEVEPPIKKIAERIVANYSKNNDNFARYLKAAEVWLSQKKISPYYIEKIIAEVKRNYEA